MAEHSPSRKSDSDIDRLAQVLKDAHRDWGRSPPAKSWSSLHPEAYRVLAAAAIKELRGEDQR